MTAADADDALAIDAVVYPTTWSPRPTAGSSATPP